MLVHVGSCWFMLVLFCTFGVDFLSILGTYLSRKGRFWPATRENGWDQNINSEKMANTFHYLDSFSECSISDLQKLPGRIPCKQKSSASLPYNFSRRRLPWNCKLWRRRCTCASRTCWWVPCGTTRRWWWPLLPCPVAKRVAVEAMSWRPWQGRGQATTASEKWGWTVLWHFYLGGNSDLKNWPLVKKIWWWLSQIIKW